MKTNNKVKALLVVTVLVVTSVSLSTVFFGEENKAQEPAEAKAEQLPPIDKQDQTPPDISNLSMPILMYHHIRTHNDPSDKIGTNLSVSPKSFAQQLDLIKAQGYETISFSDLQKGIVPDKAIILTFDDGYENFYQNAFPELSKRSMKAVVYVISNYIGNPDYLSETQLKEMASNGIEIGSHTLSHPDLTVVTPEKAAKEISESKSTLENMLGQEIVSFCYPSGKFSKDIIQLVKDNGYSFATTTKGGKAKFASPLDLQRGRVNSDTNIKYYLK